MSEQRVDDVIPEYGPDHQYVPRKDGKCKCKKCQRERCEKTCMERYGVKNPMDIPGMKERIKKVFMDKYNGATNSMEVPGVREKINKTNMDRYGVPWTQMNKEIKNKRENTCMERYGVKNPGGLPSVLDKIKDVNMKKYGVPWCQMNPEINAKTRNTMIERYGIEFAYQFPESIAKNFQVMMDKFGVKYNLQRPEIREKIKEISRLRYGTDYPLQNVGYFQKFVRTLFRTKPVTVNGIVRNLMGYEPQAVEYITSHKHPVLNRKILESELLLEDDVKTFSYQDSDEKYRMYFPDMEIKDEKQIIEVKSIFTFNSNPERNILKFMAVADSGYYMQVIMFATKNKVCDVWVFTPNGKIITRTKKTIEELKKGYEYDGEIHEDIETRDLEMFEEIFYDDVIVNLTVSETGDVSLSIT
jgi:hypothetical protein